MNWLKKMASGLFSRPVDIKDPSTWPSHTVDRPTGERQALASAAVYACVRLLADTQAALPCQLFKEDADGARTPAQDNPLYRMLHDSPNTYQTAFEFWSQVSLALELRGNAYAVKNTIGGRIVSLDLVNPDFMQVNWDINGDLHYRWTIFNETHEGTNKEIMHFRSFGGDPRGGLSTLEVASATLNLSRTINVAAIKSFENGMNPSGVLSFADFLPDARRDVITSAIEKKYAGAMNTGRPFVLEGGATWQQLSLKPEDAQMLQSRGFSIEEICRFFGVPPFMIGHTEKTTSWGTGLAEQVLGFQKFSLNPRIERLEQRLMKELLTSEDRAKGIVIEFNFDGLLRSDTLKRFQAYEIALRNGWETINSVRRMENKPPIDGGDVPRMQSQYVPITSVDQVQAQPPTPATP